MGSTFRRALVVSALVSVPLLIWEEWSFGRRLETEALALESMASTAAAEINGDLHEKVRGPQDVTGDAFLSLRSSLRNAQERYHLSSAIYTLRPVRDAAGQPATEFVVMTNPTPFVGDRYERLRGMDPVFDAGQRAHTGIYRSEHGLWVSGYAPVKASDGRTVALLEVDRPAEDLQAELEVRRALVLAVAIGIVALYALLSRLRASEYGPIAFFPRLVAGSLVVRIALAASVPVLTAVLVVWVLDYQNAKSELVGSIKDQLLTTVEVGAGFVDVAAHQDVAQSGNAGSPSFVQVRDTLRRIQASAKLASPMYTLRRDGEATRFVVMTNETPFIGDSYELRAPVRQTFEGGGAGWEGPYTDAHGTWISAWAPLRDAGGRVVAILQADSDIGTLLAALNRRGLHRLSFSVIGVLVGLIALVLVARSLTRPIRKLAQATERIATDDLDSRVDIDRKDEIGALARSFNRMVHNLKQLAGALQRSASEAEQSQELAIAASLQGLLVPSESLEARGWSVLSRVQAVEASVACDHFWFGQSRYVVFWVADVHGLSGLAGYALLNRCKSIIQAEAANFTVRPQDLAGTLDRAIGAAAASPVRVSLVLGVLDLEQSWLTLVNAGHAPPNLLRGGSDEVKVLGTRNDASLGAGAKAAFEDFEIKVEPGDTIVLVSDSLVRLRNEKDEEYGESRLAQAVGKGRGQATDELIASAWQDLEAFAGREKLELVDLCVLAVQAAGDVAEGNDARH